MLAILKFAEGNAEFQNDDVNSLSTRRHSYSHCKLSSQITTYDVAGSQYWLMEVALSKFSVAAIYLADSFATFRNSL